MIKQRLYPVFVTFILLMAVSPGLTLAEDQRGLSGTIKILGGNWEGDNVNNDTTFQAEQGRQWSISLAYQHNDFYTGLNVQGGVYTFKTTGPDQMTATSTTPVGSVEIAHSEIDLIAGYYLTRYFSLFLDLKGVSNTWQGYTHEQSFGGVGMGATALWPMNDNWLLFGILGVVNNGDVKVNKVLSGTGNYTGLDLGAMYYLARNQRLMFGLKGTTTTFDFDSGDQQVHRINGIFLGYNHTFQL